MIKIQIAKTPTQLDDVRTLLREYASIRNYDKAMGDFEKELLLLPGEYQEPFGILLIAYWKNQPAGCVAFKQLEGDFCEMKRMFVSEKFRGLKIGVELVNSILKFAKAMNFKKMLLDTHPWMTAAQAIYKKAGFIETERYNNNPTEGIRFFEKNL